MLTRDLDLEVKGGERWCVLGPNGSGKTTLLHTLAGLRTPRSGSISFSGRPWPAWSLREAARSRALLLQHQSYAFGASVFDAVLIGRHPHMGRFGWESARDRQCVAAALEQMDLTALASRDVLALSGGERQRVALAAVLAQDPQLFLLDEPTAHLDLAHQARLFEHLVVLTEARSRALVFATHEYNLAARFATHALLIYDDGQVLAGTGDELLGEDRLSALFRFPLGRPVGPSAQVFAPRW
ncbi:MAG: ABC transporter ATP-binding protein [Burkholderiales bacterium]|nr:ABC transporter ATP-binding protein [Burkholderiales bacterium]